MMDSASGVEFDHCKWDPINFCNRQLFLQNLNVANPAENIVHDCVFQPVYGMRAWAAMMGLPDTASLFPIVTFSRN